VDYNFETQALVKALKEAEDYKNTPMPEGQLKHLGNTAYYISPGQGNVVDAAFRRAFGQYTEPRIMDEQRALLDKQRAEYDALQQELIDPVSRTKTEKANILVNTLNPEYETTPGSQQSDVLAHQDSAFLPKSQKEIDIEVLRNPEELARAEHDKRMNVAMKMSNLPMAKAQADKLFAKGVDFPEKLEELRMRQGETSRLAGERNEASRARQEQTDMYRQIMAGQGQQRIDETTRSNTESQNLKISQENAKREEKTDKESTSREAHVNQLVRMQGILSELMGTPNLNSATGVVEGGLLGGLPYLSLTPGQKGTASSRIKNLQEFLQTKGLEDLRRAGVAPGSVTEKEWSKFVSRIGNIDPMLDDKSFNKELQRLYGETSSEIDRISKMPLPVAETLPLANASNQGSPAPKQSSGAPTVVKEVKLKDGRIGLLMSDGSRLIK